MKLFAVAAAAVLFVGSAASVEPQPPQPGPQPTLSVASETPVYIPVEVKVLNAAANSSSLIEVSGAAWERQGGDHQMEFTGKPGTYSVEAIYVELSGGKPKIRKLKATTKIVGDAPEPQPPQPPGPQPPGPQPPTPDTSKLPFPPSGFYAVFIRQETDMNDYTPVQRAALGGEAVATYLNTKTTAQSWRVFDVDQQFNGEGLWKEAWKRGVADMKMWESQNAGKKTPWLLCGNGTTGFSGPVPADSLDKTLEILKKFGG